MSDKDDFKGLEAWLPGGEYYGVTFGLDRSATAPTEPCMLAAPPLKEPARITGFNCNCCNSRNDYAESNQPDGTYMCYECRR